MPTGPLHYKTVAITIHGDCTEEEETEPCRCMIGVDHNASDVTYEYPESESLSASDAALIWGSSGMDEDYAFGYSEDELRDAM